MDDGTRCLLVYPRFTYASFWNYRETCELFGAKYPAAPPGMITVAAMLPVSYLHVLKHPYFQDREGSGAESQ